MKKRIALLISAVLLLSLVGTACGNTAGEETADLEEQAGETIENEPQNAAAILDAPPSSDSATGKDTSDQSEDVQEADAEGVSNEPEAQEEEKNPASVSTPVPASVTASVPVTTPPAITSPTPAQVQSPASEITPSEPTPGPEPEQPAAATREAALAYIGSSASSMIAAIGAPSSRSYAPSCLGDGEDGELIYDGFTVYTYREGDSEIVQDVL